MSLLDSIRAKKKILAPTETKVTLPSGKIVLESKSDSIVLSSSSPGFVVDFKPDLQIAHVVPHLLMGSQDVALDENLLRENSIKHILSLGITVPRIDDISYYHLPILDVPEYEIFSDLENAFSIIDSARNLNETIYVHCNAGVSRSSTVIIGYLMKNNSWSYSQSYEYLKNLRPCIRPNDGFVKQLLSLKMSFL